MNTTVNGERARAGILAEAVRSCRLLTTRYLEGFDDATYVRQKPERPNHVAWCLGHCALTMHRVAAMLDGGELLPAAFTPGTPGSRSSGSFGSEDVAFGSSPTEDAKRYPTLTRCVEIFNEACERLAVAVENAAEGKLDAQVPWGQATVPMRMLVVRMVFHNGFHTGQIADLRRGLGLGSIFG